MKLTCYLNWAYLVRIKVSFALGLFGELVMLFALGLFGEHIGFIW